MIFRLFRWPIRIVGLLCIFLFLYVNVRLYDAPQCEPITVDSDLTGQLHFLKKALHEHEAGEKAQNLYPEGFMFIHALYALAWCDAAADLPPESELRKEASVEVSYCIQQMDSPVGRAIFNPKLPLEYGAFYRGWTAYVRGRYLQFNERDSMVSQQFERDCAAIAKAIKATPKPYLESYGDLCWPADNIVCLAALSLHDRITEPQFDEIRADWLDRIKNTLTPDYQLIPHGYDLKTNQPLEGARGSSQALMLAFLPEIDSPFSQKQYQLFRKLFLDYRLGLPGIREYLHGSSGKGDIDSGPVVLGIGGAASIVGTRAARLHGDWAVSEGLSNGTGALLFPYSDGKEKSYLFGQLPVLDAFIAWSNVMKCSEYSGCDLKSHPELKHENWRWKFQVISLLLISFLLWSIWKTSIVKV